MEGRDRRRRSRTTNAGKRHICAGMCLRSHVCFSKRETLSMVLKQPETQETRFQKSPPIIMEGVPRLKWSLIAYPNGLSEEKKDHLGFLVRLVGIEGTANPNEMVWVKVKYGFTLTNETREETKVVECPEVVCFTEGVARGFERFISREKLDTSLDKPVDKGSSDVLKLFVIIRRVISVRRCGGSHAVICHHIPTHLKTEICWSIKRFKWLPGNVDYEYGNNHISWKSPTFSTGGDIGDGGNDEVIWRLRLSPRGRLEGGNGEFIGVSLRMVECGSKAEVWARFGLGIVNGVTGRIENWIDSRYPYQFRVGMEWSFHKFFPRSKLAEAAKTPLFHKGVLRLVCQVKIMDRPLSGETGPGSEVVGLIHRFSIANGSENMDTETEIEL